MNFEKAHPIYSPDARRAWLLAGDHGERCQVCHRPALPTDWPPHVIHHIIRGANGRSDEPCNFLFLCARCHSLCHDAWIQDKAGQPLPEITLGMQLWIKSQTSEWNPERLGQLYHRRLPELEPLPDYYLNLRKENRV
jgi:hypothetical protein